MLVLVLVIWMCMYVCMCMYVYVCIYVYVYIPRVLWLFMIFSGVVYNNFITSFPARNVLNADATTDASPFESDMASIPFVVKLCT